ncbi:MAG TPA: PAS domain-containing protein, partial [Desulfobacteraceae bacterium]|nr:PAS domain-containing protein [Desulfobacteraceae bacterium]
MRKPSYEELYRQVKEFENERERLKLKSATRLRKCRTKYDAMLNTVDAYMCLVDRNLRIIWANDKAKKIFGG